MCSSHNELTGDSCFRHSPIPAPSSVSTKDSLPCQACWNAVQWLTAWDTTKFLLAQPAMTHRSPLTSQTCRGGFHCGRCRWAKLRWGQPLGKPDPSGQPQETLWPSMTSCRIVLSIKTLPSLWREQKEGKHVIYTTSRREHFWKKIFLVPPKCLLLSKQININLKSLGSSCHHNMLCKLQLRCLSLSLCCLACPFQSVLSLPGEEHPPGTLLGAEGSRGMQHFHHTPMRLSDAILKRKISKG